MNAADEKRQQERKKLQLALREFGVDEMRFGVDDLDRLLEGGYLELADLKDASRWGLQQTGLRPARIDQICKAQDAAAVPGLKGAATAEGLVPALQGLSVMATGVAAGPRPGSMAAALDFSDILRQPTSALRIEFSLFNVRDVRATLSEMMKHRGLWGTVRRVSADHVVCKIVAYPEDEDAFRDLLHWIRQQGKIVQTREAVEGSIPAVLVTSGISGFLTNDVAAVNMLGLRKVFATAERIKQRVISETSQDPSSDPSDAATTESSYKSSDWYGPR